MLFVIADLFSIIIENIKRGKVIYLSIDSIYSTIIK
jgi:hypothetical protein